MSSSRPAVTAVVDDHPLFRTTIAAVVDAMPELQLGAVVATADEARREFERAAPDLALVDYSLDGETAIALLEDIRSRWPDVRCIVLSGHARPELAEEVIAAGARAYILKGRPAELDDAVRAVLAGECYISPRVRRAP